MSSLSAFHQDPAGDGSSASMSRIPPGVEIVRSFGPFGVTSQIAGRGKFAKVYVAYDTRTGRKVAARVATLEDEDVVQEVKVLRRLHKTFDKPYVVECLQKCDNGRHFVMFMEFCEGGSLEELLRARGPLDMRYIRRLFRQIAIALRCMGSLKVSHRDLKPANVMLTSRDLDEAEVRLIDFGFVKQGNIMHSVKGSPAYMAPERVMKEGYGFGAEIYAAGILLFELAYGFQPFAQATSVMALYRAQEKFELPASPEIDPTLADLIRQCLRVDPAARPTIDQVLAHAFLSESAAGPAALAPAAASESPALSPMTTESEGGLKPQSVGGPRTSNHSSPTTNSIPNTPATSQAKTFEDAGPAGGGGNALRVPPSASLETLPPSTMPVAAGTEEAPPGAAATPSSAAAAAMVVTHTAMGRRIPLGAATTGSTASSDVIPPMPGTPMPVSSSGPVRSTTTTSGPTAVEATRHHSLPQPISGMQSTIAEVVGVGMAATTDRSPRPPPQQSDVARAAVLSGGSPPTDAERIATALQRGCDGVLAVASDATLPSADRLSLAAYALRIADAVGRLIVDLQTPATHATTTNPTSTGGSVDTTPRTDPAGAEQQPTPLSRPLNGSFTSLNSMISVTRVKRAASSVVREALAEGGFALDAPVPCPQQLLATYVRRAMLSAARQELLKERLCAFGPVLDVYGRCDSILGVLELDPAFETPHEVSRVKRALADRLVAVQSINGVFSTFSTDYSAATTTTAA